MSARVSIRLSIVMIVAAAAVLSLPGCTTDESAGPADPQSVVVQSDPFAEAAAKGVVIERQDGSVVPLDQVTVEAFGRSLTLWPFTGAELNGTPMDPVNLLFTGHADPVTIRAALLGLDGDRSALGLPDAYPFNQTWRDAIGGGVQAVWTADGGWVGSVIQLTLGDYAPVRFHLRLFRSPGSDVTIGAAHFEVQIPGTTEHQVLSWTSAKDLVVGDLMRSGLLNPAVDLAPTGPITPAPGFRTIDPFIYNNLPPELLAVVGGPTPPVDAPVAIPNDGYAMAVNLAAPAAVTPGTVSWSTVVTWGQFVPRPYCAEGPYDGLRIDGDVTFEFSAVVDAAGVYTYTSGYTGLLTALPVDLATGQPMGEPFTADVFGSQDGFLDGANARVHARDQKLTHEAGGPQLDFVDLNLGERGADLYRHFNRCLDR